jgi:hypothetical protein
MLTLMAAPSESKVLLTKEQRRTVMFEPLSPYTLNNHSNTTQRGGDSSIAQTNKTENANGLTTMDACG